MTAEITSERKNQRRERKREREGRRSKQSGKIEHDGMPRHYYISIYGYLAMKHGQQTIYDQKLQTE